MKCSKHANSSVQTSSSSLHSCSCPAFSIGCRLTRVPPMRPVIGALSCRLSESVVWALSSEDALLLLSLCCCSRAAEGSGVCASPCASVDQTAAAAAAALRFSSSRLAGIFREQPLRACRGLREEEDTVFLISAVLIWTD